MKKITVILLAISVSLGLWACGTETASNNTTVLEPMQQESRPEQTADTTGTVETTESEEETTVETTVEVQIPPEITMVVNSDKADTTTHIKMYPPNRDIDQWTAYAHYYVKSDKDKETIRLRFEQRLGSSEIADENYTVKEDEYITVNSNEWLSYPFSISSTNVYFYRITFYYGDNEDALATRTVYTPYQSSYYSESSFDDTPPTFHHFTDLTSDEQAFYDACESAITAYAKRYLYTEVSRISCAWQTNENLYLSVVFARTTGGKVDDDSACFIISRKDPEKMMCTTA